MSESPFRFRIHVAVCPLCRGTLCARDCPSAAASLCLLTAAERRPPLTRAPVRRQLSRSAPGLAPRLALANQQWDRAGHAASAPGFLTRQRGETPTSRKFGEGLEAWMGRPSEGAVRVPVVQQGHRLSGPCRSLALISHLCSWEPESASLAGAGLVGVWIQSRSLGVAGGY